MDLFIKCLKSIVNCLWDGKMNQTTTHNMMLVGGSICIPKAHQLVHDFFVGKELYKSVNSNEAAAYGGAVQGMIMSVESHQKV
ncbi:unnamed protein product [Rhodiola kirilowii]